MGVNGVLGVPGKLLPIDDGVRGIDPEKLCGGLKSDEGVGGADLVGDPIAPSAPALTPLDDDGEEGWSFMLCEGEPGAPPPLPLLIERRSLGVGDDANSSPLLFLSPCAGKDTAIGEPGGS